MSADREILREFHNKLKSDWIFCSNHQGPIDLPTFYNTPELEKWMVSRTDDHLQTNGVRLARTIALDKHPHEEPESLFQNRDDSYALVLSCLLEMTDGDQIYTFKQNRINDSSIKQDRLPDSDPRLQDLPKKMRHRFREKRWAFCPHRFDYDQAFPRQVFRLIKGTILPYCEREPVTNQGATASVHKVLVPEDFVSQSMKEYLGVPFEDKNYGRYFKFALKTYKRRDKSYFDAEKEAYAHLHKESGIIHCFGYYTLEEGKDSLSYNLLLDFGSMDLYASYWARSMPYEPGDIHKSWKMVCELAKPLEAIHKITYKVRGQDQEWQCCHGDLKQENILLVRDRLHIADFGFAIVQQAGSDAKTEKVKSPGGTASFGAPEVSDISYPAVDVTPAVDMWTIGCLLSMHATWVITGTDGLERFDMFRQLLNKARGPDVYSDAFHDGEKVRKEIFEWHAWILQLRRYPDTISSKVLELVEGCLLVDQTKRISATELNDRLKAIIKGESSLQEKLAPEMPAQELATRDNVTPKSVSSETLELIAATRESVNTGRDLWDAKRETDHEGDASHDGEPVLVPSNGEQLQYPPCSLHSSMNSLRRSNQSQRSADRSADRSAPARFNSTASSPGRVDPRSSRPVPVLSNKPPKTASSSSDRLSPNSLPSNAPSSNVPPSKQPPSIGLRSTGSPPVEIPSPEPLSTGLSSDSLSRNMAPSNMPLSNRPLSTASLPSAPPPTAPPAKTPSTTRISLTGSPATGHASDRPSSSSRPPHIPSTWSPFPEVPSRHPRSGYPQPSQSPLARPAITVSPPGQSQPFRTDTRKRSSESSAAGGAHVTSQTSPESSTSSLTSESLRRGSAAEASRARSVPRGWLGPPSDILWIVEQQDQPRFNAILESHKDFTDITDDNRMTPIMIAASKGNSYMVNHLLGKCRIAQFDIEGRTVLHYAVMALRGIDSSQHQFGQDLLRFVCAMKEGDPEIMNRAGRGQSTPLALVGNDYHLAQLLVESGSEIEYAHFEQAVKKPHKDLVQCFLDKGNFDKLKWIREAKKECGPGEVKDLLIRWEKACEKQNKNDNKKKKVRLW